MSACVSCSKEIGQEDLEFANDDSAHPGILGPVHRTCYDSAVKAIPDLPWTDPISGEVDHEAMAEDLDVDDGTDDDFEEDEEF